MLVLLLSSCVRLDDDVSAIVLVGSVDIEDSLRRETENSLGLLLL